MRDAICELPTSCIAEISALGMGDPEVIPLWYGESDLPTPEVAAAALRARRTFYTYKAGLPELRAALAGYLTGLFREPIGAERVNSPSNPTGWVMSAEEIATLLVFARRRGCH